MRKLLIIPLLFFSLFVHATNYYVATTGSDAAAGTIGEPWATFQKAIDTAQPGDTVFIRGGTYTPLTYNDRSNIFNYRPVDGIGYTGTSEAPIVYTNYTGETPIFDLSTPTPSGNYNIGFYLEAVQYVKFYGLTFTGLQQGPTSGPTVNVIEAIGCANLYFERVHCIDNGGAAFRYFSAMGDLQTAYGITITSDTTKWINCDAIRNYDVGGNYGDGWKLDQDAGAYFYLEGCRALYNADDGFDISGSAIRVLINNIAFANGYVEGGNGNGFKLAGPRHSFEYSSIILINNLSAYNHTTDDDGQGFGFPDYQVSDTSYRRANARVYNNTSYKNDIGFMEFNNPLWNYRNSVYRNNIAYASQAQEGGNDRNILILQYSYPESHNTWDRVAGGYSFVMTDTVTVTDADFVSVDSTLAATELLAARSADGSLPTITFMTLAEGSDLLGAGTTYGYPDTYGVPDVSYIGTTPQIGWMGVAYPEEYQEAANLTIYNPYEGVDFSDARLSNLHAHTIESDGHQTVYQRLLGGGAGFPFGYVNRGYEIVSITDHDSYQNTYYIGTREFPFGPEPTWPWHIYNGLTGYTPTTEFTGSNYYNNFGGHSVFSIRGNELTECSAGDGTLYTHINAYFANVGWLDCPTGGFDTYLSAVRDSSGIAVFNHIARHSANAAFYDSYFDEYWGTVIGVEMHSSGDYKPTQDPRLLWDNINSLRPADSLIWGFSNSDIHQGSFDDSTHLWMNYNTHFVDTLTETAVKANWRNGAFTAHWAGQFTDWGGDGVVYPTPDLTGVTIIGSTINLTAQNCDSIQWFGTNSDTLMVGSLIDVSDYPDVNFVRAELYLDGYITYTQPFGVVHGTVPDPPDPPTPSSSSHKFGKSGGRFTISSRGLILKY